MAKRVAGRDGEGVVAFVDAVCAQLFAGRVVRAAVVQYSVVTEGEDARLADCRTEGHAGRKRRRRGSGNGHAFVSLFQEV